MRTQRKVKNRLCRQKRESSGFTEVLVLVRDGDYPKVPPGQGCGPMLDSETYFYNFGKQVGSVYTTFVSVRRCAVLLTHSRDYFTFLKLIWKTGEFSECSLSNYIMTPVKV